MSDRFDDRLPPELLDVEARLRDERAEWTPLELDRIKLRAQAQATRRRRSPHAFSKGLSMQRRLLVLLVAGLLLGGTTAAGIAGSGGVTQGPSSASDQYRPPKCNKNLNNCHCPDHSSFVVSGGQIQCGCPDGSSFDNKGNHCGCPPGEELKGHDGSATCQPKGGGNKGKGDDGDNDGHGNDNHGHGNDHDGD
jgi:hypothetical protein